MARELEPLTGHDLSHAGGSDKLRLMPTPSDDKHAAEPEPEPESEAVPPPRAHPKDPLHGVTLQTMLEQLHAHYGWEQLGRRVQIRCFTHDPSMKSSLAFLRRHPWARQEVEALFLSLVARR
jgi:hypothetical protein